MSLQIPTIVKHTNKSKKCSADREEAKELGSKSNFVTVVDCNDSKEKQALKCKGIVSKVVVTENKQYLHVDVNIKDPRSFKRNQIIPSTLMCHSDGDLKYSLLEDCINMNKTEQILDHLKNTKDQNL